MTEENKSFNQWIIEAARGSPNKQKIRAIFGNRRGQKKTEDKGEEQ